MSSDQNDWDYFFNRATGKVVYSRSLGVHLGNSVRIVSEIVDGDAGLQFALIKDELVLRATPAGRYKLKATFIEDTRQIQSLVFQRYLMSKGPLERDAFTIVGDEVKKLLDFLLAINTVVFNDSDKMHVTNNNTHAHPSNETDLRELFSNNVELLTQILESDQTQRDIIAIGYRRKQLEYFERLMYEPTYFRNEQIRLGVGPEALWQTFFEENTWIFGHGLSYVFLSGLKDRKLEQVVRGFNITGSGKRVDALMKTQAQISSLCFIEIKRHDSPLLASAYRPSAWPPSIELSGGVAQVQATVQDALEQIGRTLKVTDKDGNPTGEMLFNVEPKSFLIIGRLDEFTTPIGVNESKFRSFEAYRRNMRRPEIVTFDELLYRARFIVDNQELPTPRKPLHEEVENDTTAPF